MSLAASLGGAGLRLLLQIFLARKLGPVAFGQFVLGRSWGEVLAKFPNYGYQIGAARQLPHYELTEQHGLFRGYLRAAVVDTTVLGTVLSAGAIAVYVFFVDRADVSIVVGLLLVVPLAAAWVSRSLLQGHHRYATGSVFTEIVQPVFFGVAIVLLDGIGRLTAVAALTAWIATFAVVVVLQQIALYQGLPDTIRCAQPEYNRAEWHRSGRPLYVSHIAAIVLEQGDLIIAGALLGRADLAAYAVAGRLAVLARMVNAGMQPVTSSHLAAAAVNNDWEESQRIVDRSLRLVAPPAVLLAGAAAIFAEPLIGMFGSGYDGAVALLRIFLVGNLIDALTGPAMWVVSMSGLERVYARVMTGFAVLLLIITPLGAMLAGAVGAAFAAMLVTVGWNIGLAIVAWRRLGVHCYVRPATFRTGR